MTKTFSLQVYHPTLDDVTIIRVLPPSRVLEPNNSVEPCWLTGNSTKDDLYHRKALVSDFDGKVSVVPLHELQVNGEPLIQQVIEYEAIERYKSQ
jgi:hypothetical protein